jgi:hypothetical protein
MVEAPAIATESRIPLSRRFVGARPAPASVIKPGGTVGAAEAVYDEKGALETSGRGLFFPRAPDSGKEKKA